MGHLQAAAAIEPASPETGQRLCRPSPPAPQRQTPAPARRRPAPALRPLPPQGPAQGQKLHDTSRQLSGAVTQALGDLKAAGRLARGYGRRLSGISDYLRVPLEAPHIAAALSGLRAETDRMISESRNLAYRIGDYEQQIALLKSELKALERQALSDPLTGLGNRKDLELRLIELAAHARARGRRLSLLMIDVDHFKDLNDAFGHQTGDEILRIVARIFRSRLKGRDIPCRYGGDEFAIILPETGLAEAIQVGEGLRQALAARPLVNKRCGARFGPVTLSIGAAELRGAEPPEELLHRSDIALYRAKRDGRNRVRPEALSTEAHV